MPACSTRSAKPCTQVDIENLFDRRYTVSAHNNNILPGAPRTVRFQVIVRF
jgi:catecholate siderophore receptor